MLCGDAKNALDVPDEVRVSIGAPFHCDMVHLQAEARHINATKQWMTATVTMQPSPSDGSFSYKRDT